MASALRAATLQAPRSTSVPQPRSVLRTAEVFEIYECNPGHALRIDINSRES